ncbi:DoxX family protein [Chryseolinea sp. T2]|uniref:DoxX family protein n=1 Tax=Chryseolinea sp. T2 TaxID=3129255 RepID=UPI00307709AB
MLNRNKVNKIIYWVSTLWLSLGMLSTGIVQLLRVKEDTDFIINMGYPVYILTILGVWKLLGVVAVLVPRFLLLKEWAYAGFFFIMSGAVWSHLVLRHSFGETFPPFLLLVLTVVSWYFRPAERRLSLTFQ